MKQMGIMPDNVEQIREKDGVSVFRVQSKGKSYVLKYFEKPEYRREVENYLLLQKLDIPTIPLIAFTEEAILMEDLGESEQYRLAVPEDMKSTRTIQNVARWYKNLHQRGRDHVARSGKAMYSELDVLTRDNLRIIRQRTGTEGNAVWTFLDEYFDGLQRRADEIPKTLTYNDFYYTNLAVARDGTSALMFDYNLLGKGMAVSDVRNVTYGLSEREKAVFLKEYGSVSREEIRLDQVTSTLTALYTACLREDLPAWAERELERVKNGSLLTSAQALLL